MVRVILMIPMIRHFRSLIDPVERAGVPPKAWEGRVLARSAPLAGDTPAAQMGDFADDLSFCTESSAVIALAGYPQQICGQLGGLWITQGHRGDTAVTDRMTPAGAGRGEWR